MFSGLLEKLRFPPFLLLLIFGTLLIGSWNKINEERPPVAEYSDAQFSTDILRDSASLRQENYSPIFDLELPEHAAFDLIEPTEDMLQAGIILKPEVNLRAEPSLQSPVLKRANTGDLFSFTSLSKEADGMNWLELKLSDSQTAWVGADFVKLEQKGFVETPSKPRVSVNLPVALHLQSAENWLDASEQERLLSAAAMLGKIFKDQADEINQKNLVLLARCIGASAHEADLKQLKIYELATACSMALGWR